MKMQKIKDVLAQLSRELQRAEDIDPDVRETLEHLHRDVEELEEPGAGEMEIESLLDRVKAFESRFAATHPVLERMARELADAIAKMGV